MKTWLIILIFLIFLGVVYAYNNPQILSKVNFLSNKFIGTWQLTGSVLGQGVEVARMTFSENSVVITGMTGGGTATYKIVDNNYLQMTGADGIPYKWYYEFVNDNTVMFWGEGQSANKMVWQRVS